MDHCKDGSDLHPRERGGDLTAFRKLYQEEGMLDYLPNPEFEGEEGRENFRHYIRSMYRFYNYGIWTVLERKSGAIIGRVGIENGEYQGQSVLELGYLIGKDWRRQGFCKRSRFDDGTVCSGSFAGGFTPCFYSPAK